MVFVQKVVRSLTNTLLHPHHALPMEATLPERCWYALRIRSNFERRAHEFCQGHRLETLLPTYRRMSRKHGGPKVIDRPLFPGYLFAHIDVRSPEKVALLNSPGAVELVRFGGRPCTIPEQEIESVRIVARPDSGAQPHPFLRDGMMVQVIVGPFAGAQGILRETDDRRTTFVVSINLLGRSLGVPIEPEMVEPCT